MHSPIAIVEAALKKSWAFRYNEVLSNIEYQELAAPGFNMMNDYTLNSMARSLSHHGIVTNASSIRNLIMSDFAPRHNPFADYLGSLKPWDGKTDHIQALADTVVTTDTLLWNMCFRKWIVALVGSLLDDKIVNHTVLILSGKQGIGKTTWLSRLVPQALEKYYFSGLIRPDNKDSLTHLAECMLINLDELESLNRSEVGALKELITTSKIRMRRAYGRHNVQLIRRASFAGSVNHMEFLRDLTGSRRFLCNEAIRFDQNHGVNIDDVMAQANHLFKNGFQHWFDLAEIGTLEENNDKYRLRSMQEEALLAHFDPCDRCDATNLLTATEILSLLHSRAGIPAGNAELKSLGLALRAHGFSKYKTDGRQVYALRSKVTAVTSPPFRSAA